MHALNYQGKLKEYAAIVGKAESSLSESRKAAEVLQYFTEKIRTCEFPQNSKIRTCEFLDKTRHLYEISKADKSVWILLCDWLLRQQAHWLAIATKKKPGHRRQGFCFMRRSAACHHRRRATLKIEFIDHTAPPFLHLRLILIHPLPPPCHVMFAQG
jgi:hypothetical protein